MIKQSIAAAAFLTCCLGNPAMAYPYGSDFSQSTGAGDNLVTDSHSHITNRSNNTTTNTIADDQINHSGHTYNNNQRTYNGRVTRTRNVDRSRTRNVSQSFDYSTITNEPVQHAPVPAIPGPAAPDSVAVLNLYTQYSEGAGHVHGASVSIPLSF